ncbi:hypothetical protein [Neorhizobium galegae]|uniref:hypothetical protein n=1 Tax=Neorhizobium galegae TaxID=399 RepID=UPI0012FE8311|nr:hypothetical protein [Neorhizobium galegae]MCQ1852742.1 hypothetical protein [Neorhizobium galegae]
MKAKQFVVLTGVSVLFVGMSILPGTAAAQMEFDLRDGGVRIVRPDDDRRHYRDDDRRYYREDRRYERRYAQPGCSPRQALAAASRYIDEPRIRSVNRAFYDIDGYGKRGSKRGRPDGVRISTAPDCERSN